MIRRILTRWPELVGLVRDGVRDGIHDAADLHDVFDDEHSAGSPQVDQVTQPSNRTPAAPLADPPPVTWSKIARIDREHNAIRTELAELRSTPRTRQGTSA